MVASFRERLLEDRCCWIVFIHIVRGRPGGLLQFSKWEAVNVFLASVSSGIHAILKRRAWTMAERCSCLGCPSQLIIAHMVVPFDS